MNVTCCKNLGCLTILLASVVATPAETMRVRFTATIDTSDFVTPGYVVGDVVTRWYDYETGSPPLAIGANGTTYELPGMHLDLGGTSYEARRRCPIQGPASDFWLWDGGCACCSGGQGAGAHRNFQTG